MPLFREDQCHLGNLVPSCVNIHNKDNVLGGKGREKILLDALYSTYYVLNYLELPTHLKASRAKGQSIGGINLVEKVFMLSKSIIRF